jgi:signal transduction histidine kinase
MRYEDASENLVEMYLKVAEERFPNTCANLNIKLMFDTKRRVSRGKLVLASIEIASAKVKYFTKHEVAVGEGVDYVLIIDQKAWELANAEDKVRLISHELRHVFIDDNDKHKLLPHDIEDFAVEVKLNADNPDWALNLAVLVTDVYEQERDLKKLDK